MITDGFFWFLGVAHPLQNCNGENLKRTKIGIAADTSSNYYHKAEFVTAEGSSFVACKKAKLSIHVTRCFFKII